MITFPGSCRYVFKEDEGQVGTQHLNDFIKYPQKEILGFGTFFYTPCILIHLMFYTLSELRFVDPNKVFQSKIFLHLITGS